MIDDTLKVFNTLKLREGSTNVKALEFLFKYRDIDFINNFLNEIHVLLLENNDKVKLQKLLNSLNSKNWDEIDSCLNKETPYYYFLRIKVFLLTVEYNSDLKEDMEWLTFFEENFLLSLSLYK